jgi:hypothetical protein
MNKIKKIVFSYLFADLALILLSIWQGSSWLINTQIAFFSSLVVTLASFFSYKKMVSSKTEAFEASDERDEIDKIDDKFELFTDTEEDKKEEDFKEIFKKEKKLVSRVSFSNLKNSYKGALSLYRLAAYLFLAVGFLYLQRHGILNIMPYFLGLFVVPFVSVFWLIAY